MTPPCHRQPFPSRPSPGFTLVEVLAVLALAALLCGTAAFSLKAGLDEAEMKDVIRAIKYQDTLMRQHARTYRQPSELLIDVSGGRFSCRTANDVTQTTPAYVLPEGYEVRNVLVDSRYRQGNEITIACSSGSQTASYALLIQGPDRSKAWILVAGLTGQASFFDEEEQIRRVFESLSVK